MDIPNPFTKEIAKLLWCSGHRRGAAWWLLRGMGVLWMPGDHSCIE